MTNYFPHDSNARNDEKLIRLRMRHKAAGYGVYFMILERMREENDYMCVKDYNIIAFDLREDAALIKSVVEDFGLFVFTEDGKYFYSDSFLRRMTSKDETASRRAEAGKKGMESRWKKKAENQEDNNKAITKLSETDNNVITMLSSNDNKAITSKGKERKESKENNIPPLPPQGGVGEEDFISSLEDMTTSTRVVELTKYLAELGLNDDDVDEYLRYSNLGATEPGWMPRTKEDAFQRVFYFKNHGCPQAPYAAIKAVRDLNALIADDADRQAIINTFLSGTLAERKAAADKVNAIITTIRRRRGTPQEVNAPAAFMRKMLNS